MKPKVKNLGLVDDEGLIDSILGKAKKEDLHFVDRASEIAATICAILEEKGLKKKDLASLLDKEPAEISKMLCGTHNFTLRTLATIETVLQAEVLYTKMGERVRDAKLGRRKWYATINKPMAQKGESKNSLSESTPLQVRIA